MRRSVFSPMYSEEVEMMRHHVLDASDVHYDKLHLPLFQIHR